MKSQAAPIFVVILLPEMQLPACQIKISVIRSHGVSLFIMSAYFKSFLSGI